jgi:transposase
VARQDAKAADLRAQLAEVLKQIDKLKPENARLRAGNARLREEKARLRDEKARLCDENARLRDENAQLQQRLATARKNSSTSSKPPSSDLVKPKKPRGKGRKKRKRGGQSGHPRHERPAFPPEKIDEFLCYTLEGCPDCGGELLFSRKADPRVVQQVELIAAPLKITEHKALAYWCPRCKKVHYASVPDAVGKTGLFGPRLMTLVGFMKGVCHASFTTIRKFLRDVAGIRVSRGYLAKVIARVTECLTPAYEELLARLPREAFLNVDETGHKENARKFWTWCFRAQLYTQDGRNLRFSHGPAEPPCWQR